jgi:hypothetical protein
MKQQNYLRNYNLHLLQYSKEDMTKSSNNIIFSKGVGFGAPHEQAWIVQVL